MLELRSRTCVPKTICCGETIVSMSPLTIARNIFSWKSHTSATRSTTRPDRSSGPGGMLGFSYSFPSSADAFWLFGKWMRNVDATVAMEEVMNVRRFEQFLGFRFNRF